MHRWWLNSSRREFGITIETTFTRLLDCRLVRYWVFFLQQRSCVKSWHSTAQLWLHVWGWGLKLTEGQKKDQDIAEYKCGTVCAQNNQEADFQIACATFFSCLFYRVPCSPMWFGSWRWQNSLTPGLKGSALHCDIKVKGYFWCFL